MPKQKEVIIRFDDVSFKYTENKSILEDVSFSIRKGSKTTLMGQNGAGKSTIFKLILKEEDTNEGEVHINKNIKIAIAKQVISKDDLDISLREFFEKCFKEKVYNIDPKIDAVLEAVNLKADKEKKIKSFSGGQQARLLLASALIQNADVLLLDEPTNNLDKEGIKHLTNFLIRYNKTCIVISHDADFLNSFTDGVLYLDVFTKSVQKFDGNYFDVVSQISAQIEKENRKNAQFQKQIIANKEKANFFANKGGRMRALAKKMREKASEMEESKINVRKEDKSIRDFQIPSQEGLIGEILNISSFSIMQNGKVKKKKAKISLRKNNHLLISGSNGIGKSTLIEAIANKNAEGVEILNEVKIGYYRQDFSTLNFKNTVYQELASAMPAENEEILRSTAAGFLLDREIIYTKIENLSEGQKGLVAFAKLTLQKPGLLILDEPTNHINFRHIPIIAKALDQYEGAMILVSHVPEFVKQIRIDEKLDLAK